MTDLLIIGGGIIGLSTAYKFQKQNPESTVVVLEKEPASVCTKQGAILA